jgi:hypothetical protein
MYLETWMIATLILSFGVCAWLSRRSGFTYGAITTLQMLEENRLIKVEEDGSIKRWAPYNDVPVKKTRTKKVK